MSFSFGDPTTQAAETGFNLVEPKIEVTVEPTVDSSEAAPEFSAGAGTSTFVATVATVTAPTFGVPAATAPTFSVPAATAATIGAAAFFGRPAATESTFGMPGVTAPIFGAQEKTEAPAFGGFGATGASPSFGAASSAETKLNFGADQATLTTPTIVFSGAASTFGKAAAASSLNFNTKTTSLYGGLFHESANSISETAAPAPFVGFGGNNESYMQPKTGDSKQDQIKIKEKHVPEDISKMVDAIMVYVNMQRKSSSDIGRRATSKLENVSSEIANLQRALREIAKSAEVNYNQIQLLHKETTTFIQSVEIEHRTQNMPAGWLSENTAPFQHLQCLVAKYEMNLRILRQEIAHAEGYMLSLSERQFVSADVFNRGLQHFNDTFIFRAESLREIQQMVEAFQQQYLK